MDLLRSLPLGLYLEEPQTWLHKLDPRIKFIWLTSFLTSYIFANNYWRVLLVAVLIITTLFAKIPKRVWKQQMGWLLFLAVMVLLLGAISPDGFSIDYQPRLPIQPAITTPAKPFNLVDFIQNLLNGDKDYSYVLFHKSIFRITRYSLSLAISLSSMIFTVIYSTNLYLLTTAPEEITSGMESLMKPLRWLKLPVTEIALTLTLSLRFIPLVLEEVQNLVRSVMTRAINWKKLGLKGATKVWLIIIERLLDNLLLRAAQMADAMLVRGFTSANEHRVQWQDLKLRVGDWLAIGILILFWGMRIAFGTELS